MGETARMMPSRKGILYTLGLTLFALALLGVAMLFLRQEQSTQERFIELGGRRNIGDIEQSTYAAFTEAVRRGGFRFSFTANSFTINSSLPLNMSNLTVPLALIEENVERDFPFIKIDNQSFLDQKRFILMPSMIHYLQSTSTEAVIEPEEEGASAINGFNVRLRFAGNITSCTSNVGGGGSLTVQVLASSAGGNCTILLTNGVKDLTMDIGSQGKSARLEIKDEDSGQLKLKSDAPLSSSITVIVPTLTEHGSIALPMNFTINHSALSYTKSSSIRLLS